MMSESNCKETSSPKPKRRRRSSVRIPNENPARDSYNVKDSDHSENCKPANSTSNTEKVEASIAASSCVANSTDPPPHTDKEHDTKKKKDNGVVPHDNPCVRETVIQNSHKNVIDVPILTFKTPQPTFASNGCANTEKTFKESDFSLTVYLDDDNSNSSTSSSVVTAPSVENTNDQSLTNGLNGHNPINNDNNPTKNDNNLSNVNTVQSVEPQTPSTSYHVPIRSDSFRERIAALCSDKNMHFNSKKNKVNIFTEQTGPKWYEADGCTITNSIVPHKLIEAFSFLPTYGKPDNQKDLTKYLDKKVQEFVGSGLKDDEFLKLQKLCREDLLKTCKEPTPKETFSNINQNFLKEFLPPRQGPDNPEGYQLRIIKKHKIRTENDPANAYTKKLKYRGIRVLPMASPNNGACTPTESDLQPGQDLVYTIRLYRPFSYNSRAYKSACFYPHQRLGYRHSVFSQNIVLLGRQKLTALRDRIVCPNDVDMRIDVSERIDDTALTCAKELFPSGFLFINNVFYVDTRPGCHDTSLCMRQWAAERGLGPFPVAEMSAVRVGDIALRLGHPDVYMHQGNCEHLFTFSDIRLLSPFDPLSSVMYPTHTAVSQFATIYCSSCAEFPSKWITTDTEKVPFDPAHFCDTCIKMYLYKDGKKIGNFKAYSYRGNEINILKPQG